MLYRATSADLDVMAAIHAAAFPSVDAWSHSVFDLQLAMPNVFALLHQAGGLILVRVAADEAEILTLAVAPGVRRGGIGSSLLLQATTMIVAEEVYIIFLEVSDGNIGARALYRKTGFRQVGRRPQYYSDGSDALVLRRNTGSPN